MHLNAKEINALVTKGTTTIADGSPRDLDLGLLPAHDPNLVIDEHSFPYQMNVRFEQDESTGIARLVAVKKEHTIAVKRQSFLMPGFIEKLDVDPAITAEIKGPELGGCLFVVLRKTRSVFSVASAFSPTQMPSVTTELLLWHARVILHSSITTDNLEINLLPRKGH